MSTARDNAIAALKTEIETIGCLVVSEGTLRTYDLVTAMLPYVRKVAPAEYQQLFFTCGMTPEYVTALEDGESHPYWDSEASDELQNNLHELLSDAAPEGFYFGSHPGDGAAIGFWPSYDDE